MIRNFEEFTGELTDDERDYIFPRLIKILSTCIGKEKALTNSRILESFNVNNPIYSEEEEPRVIKTRQNRIRHMIHILRVTDTIPFLIATAKGYYISNDYDEIKGYMQSIDDRLRAIYQIRRAMKRQIEKHNTGNVPQQGILIF